MPSTNFPKGISLTGSVHTVEGHISGITGTFTGLLSAGQVIGDVWSQTVSFSTASTAQTVCAGSPPDWATDLVGAFVTVGSVSAIVAAYTVQGGSAGTVHVSSENNGSGVAYSKSSLTIDTAAITTTAGITVTRGVQGTAGDSYLTLIYKRTAA
jgi:hypothetical protein